MNQNGNTMKHQTFRYNITVGTTAVYNFVVAFAVSNLETEDTKMRGLMLEALAPNEDEMGHVIIESTDHFYKIITKKLTGMPVYITQ